MKKIIRKSTISLNSANSLKKVKLENLFMESKRVMNELIKIIWEKQDFKSKFTDIKIDTWLSARMQQCLGKQALGVVKSQHKKKKKSCPIIKGNAIELDERFVTFLPKKNSFDLWLKIASLGNKIQIILPSKAHYHLNLLLSKEFIQKKSTRLRMNKSGIFLDVFFEKEIQQRNGSHSVGIDVGINKLITTSEGLIYGKDIEPLLYKINKKKQGSKAFKRALIERNEYINKSIKEMLGDTKASSVVLEDIKNLNYKKKSYNSKKVNKNKRWVYSYLKNKIVMEAEVVGVQCLFVNPAYTSQTCNSCNYVDKNSRQREIFKCTSCRHAADADMNASLNILMRGVDMGQYGAQKYKLTARNAVSLS